MIFDHTETTDAAVDAASALLDCYAAGVIAIPPSVPFFQRSEIERELRVGAQIMRTLTGADANTFATGLVQNIRHGLATCALTVTNDAAAAHVQATIRSAPAAVDTSPSVWFDEPGSSRPGSGAALG